MNSSSANFEYLQYLAGEIDQKAIVRDLMNAYGNDVWNFAFALSCTADQADAIAQETFVRAYRSLRLYRGETTVKAWLLSITRHASLTCAKPSLLQRVRRNHGGEADSSGINASWKKVIGLPLKFREALILSAHHRLSLAEIAFVLELPEETAKARLHEARLKAIEAKGG